MFAGQVAGVNGFGENPLGSVSTGLVLQARCTSIIVKRAVEDDSTAGNRKAFVGTGGMVGTQGSLDISGRKAVGQL